MIIRTDASVAIGSGHVMRCMTLATELKERGAEVSFICRESAGNLNDFLEQKGFHVDRIHLSECTELPKQAWEEDAQQVLRLLNGLAVKPDWLIVDHYLLDYRWGIRIRPFARGIFVIDDLANRKHECDILIDQNYCENFSSRYESLVPSSCKQLLGPKYALLRKEFTHARGQMRKPVGQLERILVTFGGSDPGNESGKCLEALKELDSTSFGIDLVIGSSNPHKGQLEAASASLTNVKVHSGIDYMAKLMATAGFAICAGGSTTLERFCLGLPGLVITIAENQVEVARMSHRSDIDVYLGPAELVTVSQLKESIYEMVNHPSKLIASSARAMELVDGNGVKRVANQLLNGADNA